MTVVKNPISVICTFLWIGFVCAISFMEAWLKFQAPGISIPLGLGIGRLVFDALNKVEWVLAIGIIISGIVAKEKWLSSRITGFGIGFIVLIIQTFWLLPALDIRAESIINLINVPNSNLHLYYVALEIIKAIALIIFGISHFKTLQ